MLSKIWKALGFGAKQKCSMCENPIINPRSHPGHQELCTVCGDPIYRMADGDGMEGATELGGWAHSYGNHYHYAMRKP